MRKKTQAALTWSLLGPLLGILLPAAAIAAAEAGPEPQVAPGHSGPVSATARDGDPRVSQSVRALQRQLRRAGEEPGPVDGRLGPLTAAAVRRFQRQQGLAVDGVAGPLTVAALSRPGTLMSPGTGEGGAVGARRVRRLQRQLRRAGERPGPVDGRFGPLTEAAVKRFQRAAGLAVTGLVSKTTGAALAKRLAAGPVSEPATVAAPRPAPIAVPVRPAGRSARARPERPAGEDDGGPDLPGGWASVAGLAVVLALLLAALPVSVRRARRRSKGRPPAEAGIEVRAAPEEPTPNRPRRPRAGIRREQAEVHSGARSRRPAETARAAQPAAAAQSNGTVVVGDSPAPPSPGHEARAPKESPVPSPPERERAVTKKEPVASPPKREGPATKEQPVASPPAPTPPVMEEEPVASPPTASRARDDIAKEEAMCEIAWRPGYLRHRFRAVGRPPGSQRTQVIAESPNLQLFPMSDPDPPDEDLIAAAKELMESLVDAGWRRVESGNDPDGPWYAQRFEWAGNGKAAPPADKTPKPSQRGAR